MNPYDHYPRSSSDSRVPEPGNAIVVTLKIEASSWTLGRSLDGDQWIRTWKDWPDEKALAARVVQKAEEFHYTCWGIYAEGHIGYGKASDFETAKTLADDTLREYCQASAKRDGPTTAELVAEVGRLRLALRNILEVASDADNLFAMSRPIDQVERVAKDALDAST